MLFMCRKSYLCEICNRIKGKSFMSELNYHCVFYPFLIISGI